MRWNGKRIVKWCHRNPNIEKTLKEIVTGEKRNVAVPFQTKSGYRCTFQNQKVPVLLYHSELEMGAIAHFQNLQYVLPFSTKRGLTVLFGTNRGLLLMTFAVFRTKRHYCCTLQSQMGTIAVPFRTKGYYCCTKWREHNHQVLIVLKM